jgi:hypothetical protein
MLHVKLFYASGEIRILVLCIVDRFSELIILLGQLSHGGALSGLKVKQKTQ